MALAIKNLPAKTGDIRDSGSILGLGRSLGEGGWLPTPVFLPGESHHQRSLAGCSLSIGSQRVRHDSSDLADMHARPNKV